MWKQVILDTLLQRHTASRWNGTCICYIILVSGIMETWYGGLIMAVVVYQCGTKCAVQHNAIKTFSLKEKHACWCYSMVGQQKLTFDQEVSRWSLVVKTRETPSNKYLRTHLNSAVNWKKYSYAIYCSEKLLCPPNFNKWIKAALHNNSLHIWAQEGVFPCPLVYSIST